jgi:hypothetical protein
MSNTSSEGSATRRWKLTAALLSLVVVCLGAWGALQFKKTEELSRSVATAQEQLAQTQARLTDAESRLAAVASKLAAKEVQLAEVAKPDLPVSVSFRAALLGSGLVAMFKNHSSRPIEVAAEFSSTVTGANRSANLVLEPNGLKEIGHAEGWAFAVGQHIRLTSSQFRPAEYEVPGT